MTLELHTNGLKQDTLIELKLFPKLPVLLYVTMRQQGTSTVPDSALRIELRFVLFPTVCGFQGHSNHLPLVLDVMRPFQ